MKATIPTTTRGDKGGVGSYSFIRPYFVQKRVKGFLREGIRIAKTPFVSSYFYPL